MRNAWIIATAVMLPLAGACNRTASAPGQDPSTQDAAATSGPTIVSVGDGFAAQSVDGTVTANRSSATVRPECDGFIEDNASVVLSVTKMMTLRLSAAPTDDPNADLILVAMAPDGSVLCSDDADGLNPRLESHVSPGDYRVWVGTYTEKKTSAFRLLLENVLLTVPEGPEPTPIADGNYGGLHIGPETGVGTLRGRAGGTRQANTIGPGCTGFIGMRPDHVLQLDARERLRVVVRATDADLVLLMQNADGRVLCNDDADGLQPELYEDLNAGTWNVYVGSYRPSHYPEYVLRVSR